MTSTIRLFAFALVYCVLAGACASSANAGTYTISSCHFRDGAPAPTDLWRVILPQPGATYDLSCTDGSGIGVAFAHDRAYPPGYLTGVGIRVPPDLSVVAASVRDQRWTSGSTDWATAAGYFGSLKGVPAWQGITVCEGGGCSGELKDWRLIWESGAELQNFGIGVYCSPYRPKPCPNTSVAAAYATGVELTISDPFPPTLAEEPDGSLLDRHSSAAIRTLRYSVVDRGSGVRSVTLEVDGRVVKQIDMGAKSPSCTLPYSTPLPCPAEAIGAFSIDTSAFTPGPHAGRLVVRDASDGSPLVHDFSFRAPGPPANLAACTPGARVHIDLVKNPVPFNARKIAFTLEGLPVREPTVLVMEQVPGAFNVIAPAQLGARNYTAYFRSTGPRTLRVAVPIDGGAAYVCSDPVRLGVRAGLTLRVSPHSVFNGQTIRFRGRLFGGALAGGRLVEIQARVRGSRRPWSLVRTIVTGASGRFGSSYTFQRTSQRVRFVFRAVRKAGDGFPYAFGASRSSLVLVRG